LIWISWPSSCPRIIGTLDAGVTDAIGAPGARFALTFFLDFAGSVVAFGLGPMVLIVTSSIFRIISAGSFTWSGRTILRVDIWYYYVSSLILYFFYFGSNN
jgi:hypothetical protein